MSETFSGYSMIIIAFIERFSVSLSLLSDESADLFADFSSESADLFADSMLFFNPSDINYAKTFALSLAG